MNFFKQLMPMPWDMVRNAIDETKEDFDAEGKRRHDSVLSGIGKYTDPLTFLLGKKYTNFVHETIPREINRAMEPAVQFGHNFNPLYWYGKQTGNEALNQIHDMGNRKGGDILGMVMGGVFGGGALAGGGGAGGGGAGGGGFGGWGNYMGGGMPSMPQQQQMPRPIPPAYIPNLLDFGGSPYPVNRGLLGRNY